MIDLRSDTVTMPDESMRKAMAEAVVGDDVYGEDPTINKLEKTAAEMVGKEEALFVPSGTMGNQIAILMHTARGDEVIIDADAHIAFYEVGAPSMLAGVQLSLVPGLLEKDTLDKIKKAYRGDDIHFPRSRLLCLENTFNRGGGKVIKPQLMMNIFEVANGLGLAVHLDGARVFNAAVALGCDVRELTRSCDTVMFCLSKGLGAPVGSILSGSSEFIAGARKYRKALGGGMRQAGVLAAAGLLALQSVQRLEVDHHNARILAEGLNDLAGFGIDLGRVQSNMVLLDTTEAPIDAATFVEQLKNYGVKAIAVGPQTVRFVTHKDVSRGDIERTVEVAGKVINSNS